MITPNTSWSMAGSSPEPPNSGRLRVARFAGSTCAKAMPVIARIRAMLTAPMTTAVATVSSSVPRRRIQTLTANSRATHTSSPMPVAPCRTDPKPSR